MDVLKCVEGMLIVGSSFIASIGLILLIGKLDGQGDGALEIQLKAIWKFIKNGIASYRVPSIAERHEEEASRWGCRARYEAAEKRLGLSQDVDNNLMNQHLVYGQKSKDKDQA